jgi:tetratricopeptide (TPR) repeat protein
VEVVGRRREQRALAELLDRAQAGLGGVVVLIGPPGSGLTTLAEATVADATARGLPVARSVDAADDAGEPRLLVIDQPDTTVELPAVDGPVAVVITARRSLSAGDELFLTPLTVDQLRDALALDDASAEAVWLASGGRPGPAAGLATELTDLVEATDPVVALALRVASRAEYLDVDPDVVRLLEVALLRTADEVTRARLLGRLAHELLGDAATVERRQALADEALELARRSEDAETLALVLDARLHALWGPDGASDRLATSSEIVDLARRAGDREREARGIFWRFVALMELGRVAEAEAALAAYERAAAGDPEAAVVVASRRAMLAILRGRYELAERLIAQVDDDGHRIGLVDTDRLLDTLRAAIIVDRGPSLEDALHLDQAVRTIEALSLRLPGHFFETVIPTIYVLTGHLDEAATELERQLGAVLQGSGPRWLSATCDLARVAAAVGDREVAARLVERLATYHGQLAVRGGANTFIGPVSYFLGLLAQALGRREDAVEWFAEAIDLLEEIGALPALARTLWDASASASDPAVADALRARARSIAERLDARFLVERPVAPTRRWALLPDGDDWQLDAGDERVRLRDSRGVEYLRALLGAPGREISALDLAAGGTGLVAADSGPVLDDDARAAYRRRLARLEADLDAADRSGDAVAAARFDAERAALVDELRRATGLGGRPRAATGEAERARVNVTRTLRATLDRIRSAAPACGAHLEASIRTGRACSYQPAPGGPAGWTLS